MKRVVLAAVGLSLVGGLGFSMLYKHHMSSPIGEAEPVDITIGDGATWDRAAELLADEGLNPHPMMFDLRARQRGKRTALKAGTYRFDRGMSPDQVMDRLAAGPADASTDERLALRIIPGDTIWRVETRLNALGIDTPSGFGTRPKRVRRLGVAAPTRRAPGAHTLLEGYLHPETYFLPDDPTLDDALKRATRQFTRVFSALKKRHAASYARLKRQYGFTDHDFVILASLIEREVRVHAEARRVAGVFYNRLTRGQRLETDPTLVYGPDTWKEIPSPRFRRDRSNPYNTYAHKGLPPGPICSPGENALEAALNPASTKAIYFVAMRDGTGRHAFATTHEEHKANVQRYLERR